MRNAEVSAKSVESSCGDAEGESLGGGYHCILSMCVCAHVKEAQKKERERESEGDCLCILWCPPDATNASGLRAVP